MNSEDIYFAGLFDGEGCVTIDKAKSRAVNGSPIYRLTVQLAGVDRRPLDKLQFAYGGGVYKQTWQKLTLSQAYTWTVVSRQAAKFLERIRPCLIVKREEVDIALAFQKHVTEARSYGRRLADEEIAYREECREMLQRLKRRFRTAHP